MSHAEKHIVNAYSGLFEGLSTASKLELIESLTKSLKAEKDLGKFYQSFGAFASNKSAEEIIADIKSSRRFSGEEINF